METSAKTGFQINDLFRDVAGSALISKMKENESKSQIVKVHNTFD